MIKKGGEKMKKKIFLDTASIEEVRRWNKRGIVEGVTTNQKIFLAEGGIDFKTRVLEICQEVDGDVSIELTSYGVNKMVKEAEKYAKWHQNVTIKVPMTTDGSGLAVIKRLSKRGIKTNATVMMTCEQLMLAAKAGATYVSLFFNRSQDSGEDAVRELRAAKDFITKAGLKAQIIAGSIRNPKDVGRAYEAGADIVTIPPNILEGILQNKKTEETIKEFDEAWAAFQQAQKK